MRKAWWAGDPRNYRVEFWVEGFSEPLYRPTTLAILSAGDLPQLYRDGLVEDFNIHEPVDVPDIPQAWRDFFATLENPVNYYRSVK